MSAKSLEKIMDNKFLEQFYENVILPQYSDEVSFVTIVWKDHGKVDLDAWAHYFDDQNGKEYVLLYEDFPGSTFLDDGLTHEVVKIGNETSMKVSLSTDKVIDNFAGYFTLYREK